MLTNALNRAACGRYSRPSERGLSLVELMVGMVIGLFVVVGVLTVFVTNLVGSRNLVRDVRVNQDLRIAADLIARDLRRAGYWANATEGVLNTATSTATTTNPYNAISGTYGATSSAVNYNFARDTNDTLNSNESFGFRLSGGAIQIQLDSTPNWQSVTDPDIVTVTKFQITDVKTEIAVGDLCTRGCNTSPPTPKSAPTTACPSPPTLTTHRFDIVIEANAANDATVKRTLRESVRVRNNQNSGQCP